MKTTNQLNRVQQIQRNFKAGLLKGKELESKNPKEGNATNNKMWALFLVEKVSHDG